MIVKKTGEIRNGFYVMGTPGIPVFLLDGEVPVLFDAGFSAVAPAYIEDIRAVLGERQPATVFLSHSHFDHIGAVSHFKRAWPQLTVAGSQKCARVLQNPRAVELIRVLSREGARLVKDMHDGPVNFSPFEPFTVDTPVADGQTIRLEAGLHVEVIGTPGHTWDFLSYWIPEKKILIASEAVGCRDDGGYLQTEFLVDIDAYIASLKRMEELKPDVVCAGHYSVLTGPDALAHITGSIRATTAYRERAENYLRQENFDVDRAALKVKAFEWDPRPWPKQPETAYMLNTRQRVLTVLSQMPDAVKEA